MIFDEWYLGSLGIEAYFGKRKPRISMADVNAAAKADETITRYAKEFAAAAKPNRFPEEGVKISKYDEIAEELMDEPRGVIESWQEKMPDEIQDAFQVMKLDVHNYLKSQLPVQPISGGIFATPLPPSDTDVQRFMWQVQVIDDIEYALKMMNAGAFSMVENLCLRTLFPDVHTAIVLGYLNALIDHAQETKEAYTASWKLSSLSGLTGMPITSYQDVMGYQTGFEEKEAGQPMKPGTIKIASANATDTQKIEADSQLK